MSQVALPRVVAAAAATAAVLLLAGCGGPDGPSGPRLLVGDGPVGDEWDDVDAATGGGGGGRQRVPDFSPPRADPATPTPTPEPQTDPDPSGEGEGGAGPAAPPSAAWLALAPAEGDPSVWVVSGHGDGADWASVAISVDAGEWLVVVDDGAGGEYPLASGVVAVPESWEVVDGARLAFCDASGVDGVTGTSAQVTDRASGQVLLRERIQAPAC